VNPCRNTPLSHGHPGRCRDRYCSIAEVAGDPFAAGAGAPGTAADAGSRRPSRASRRRFAALIFGALTVTLAAADWPQFRGPYRNGTSPETGLLPEWPASGPRLAWQADRIGTGYSSPVVQGETVWVTGDVGDDLVISALDRRTGTLRWRTPNGRAWKGQFPGARSTCTVADGRLYVLNAHGRLLCADAASGRELWAVDVLARFGGRGIEWGLSECPLVDRGRVVVTAGGDTAFLAALEAQTGETVWASPPLRFTRTMAFGGKRVEPPVADIERAGYASPILVETGGRRCLAAVGARHVVLADADTGELLWTRELPVIYDVIGTIPTCWDAGVLFAAPDVGALLVRLEVVEGKLSVTERWRHRIDPCHGGFVPVNGVFYGSGYRLFRPWIGLDAATGAVRCEVPNLGPGCALFADQRLYVLTEKGDLALLRPTPEGLVNAGRFSLPGAAAADVWSHPAIAAGHLFVRRHDSLFCYDIRTGAP
jgi:outer membrane protein assembly factor BamB